MTRSTEEEEGKEEEDKEEEEEKQKKEDEKSNQIHQLLKDLQLLLHEYIAVLQRVPVHCGNLCNGHGGEQTTTNSVHLHILGSQFRSAANQEPPEPKPFHTPN